MLKPLDKFSGNAYALLRLVTGFMFCFHGIQKIFGILSPMQPPVGSLMWFGGMIELIGGALVLIGFQTRLAAFICSGEMAVAYFMFHYKFQGGAEIFPAINKGEPAALYSFVFLLIACKGAGKWGLDKS